MNRFRKRKFRKRLRANLLQLGLPRIAEMSDAELDQFVSSPGVKEALQGVASGGNPLLSREQVKRAPSQPATWATRSHDDAGDELLLLRGGPMDGLMVRAGAPVLEPNWSRDGRYVTGGRKDGQAYAEWFAQ